MVTALTAFRSALSIAESHGRRSDSRTRRSHGRGGDSSPEAGTHHPRSQPPMPLKANPCHSDDLQAASTACALHREAEEVIPMDWFAT
jgi:hypothetical protein